MYKEYNTDGIEIYFDDSDREDSVYSDEKNLINKALHKMLLLLQIYILMCIKNKSNIFFTYLKYAN